MKQEDPTRYGGHSDIRQKLGKGFTAATETLDENLRVLRSVTLFTFLVAGTFWISRQRPFYRFKTPFELPERLFQSKKCLRGRAIGYQWQQNHLKTINRANVFSANENLHNVSQNIAQQPFSLVVFWLHYPLWYRLKEKFSYGNSIKDKNDKALLNGWVFPVKVYGIQIEELPQNETDIEKTLEQLLSSMIYVYPLWFEVDEGDEHSYEESEERNTQNQTQLAARISSRENLSWWQTSYDISAEMLVRGFATINVDKMGAPTKRNDQIKSTQQLAHYLETLEKAQNTAIEARAGCWADRLPPKEPFRMSDSVSSIVQRLKSFFSRDR